MKQRIGNLQNPKLKEGLSEDLSKLVSEFESRNINEEDTFLRKNFLITTEK